jgi:tetratricopeptide (TPR) repeat protein
MKNHDQTIAPITAIQCACIMALSWIILPDAAHAAAAPGVDIPAVIRQAKDYQIRFRDGELDVAAANVALMEKATTAEPGNADLWYAMAHAYVDFAARGTMPGGNRPDVMVALQKGMPALNRALQINPQHAEALSLRAGMRAMMGMQMNSPDLAPQALADMNRAVELAPKSAAVRLIRAFSGPVMADALRNRANEAADLEFLIEASDRSRAGDFMTILRADLHIDNGEVDGARRLYEMVSGTGAASAAQLAKSRLSLIPQGREVMMKEIKALRAVAGTQCSMCHGRETAPASPR